MTQGEATAERELKRFYRRFKQAWSSLGQQIQGLPGRKEQEDYALLTLKRVCVLYFLQKQKLLNGDVQYLLHSLRSCRDTDQFYNRFWLPLCQHLACQNRASSSLSDHLPICALPLFMPHPPECSTFPLLIPDRAFEQLFLFCEQYDWCCDYRPSQQRELHPDILAYICEQQSDQKQIGVYYTSNDVTLYMADCTIVSAVLNTLCDAKTGMVMKYDAWRLLVQYPERYIVSSLSSTGYLPAETGSECQVRLLRYEQQQQLLCSGQVRDIDTLITLRLDMRQFLLDTIRFCEEPAALLDCYHILENLTILDPTCGSGAFLIAALEILVDLYTACLERLAQLAVPSNHIASFWLLEQVQATGSLQQFVVMQVVTRNLYGVELVTEAKETCRLRLYLAVLAHTIETEQVLPIMQFIKHIHVGDVLLGTPYQQKEVVGQKPSVSNEKQTVEVFHWRQYFPEVLAAGGFHVILGNPPYVEYRKIQSDYGSRNSGEKRYGNLYAAVLERSLTLCRPGQSYLGLVVPLSICSGLRFAPLRSLLLEHVSSLWLANFEIFPDRLFEGAFQRLSLLIAHRSWKSGPDIQLYTTRIQRWYSVERPHLFDLLAYNRVSLGKRKPLNVFPKLASPLHQEILRKVADRGQDALIADMASPHRTPHFLYYQEAINYWMKVVCRVPFYRKNGILMPPPHGRFLFFKDQILAQTVMALMNSSLFYLWFVSYADGFHVSQKLVATFPVGRDLFLLPELPELAVQLEEDIRRYVHPATRNPRRVARKPGAHTLIELEEFQMSCSKLLLDKIDHVLAGYYGFGDEEFDFIVHYDMKYRMGRKAAEIPQ